MSDDQQPGDGDRFQREPVPPYETLAALAAQVADIRGNACYRDPHHPLRPGRSQRHAGDRHRDE